MRTMRPGGSATVNVTVNNHGGGAPLPWKLDYVDAAAHRQVVVQGIQAER